MTGPHIGPDQFYILASTETVHIPPDYAAEMVPFDPPIGEFRVHYAGFFDPGFGYTEHGNQGSRAVLEVRRQKCRLYLSTARSLVVWSMKLSEAPDVLYGQTSTSNYQGQGLKLSKHFRG